MKTILSNPNHKEGIISDLSEFITSTDKILDIGCRLGNQLFPFVDYGFKELIGIDNDEFNKKHVFRNFLLDRNDYNRYTFIEKSKIDLHQEDFTPKYWKEVFPKQAEIFDSRFKFEIDKTRGKIENYNILENSFDIIIASKILHFLPIQTEEIQIDKIIKGLKKNGIAYIAINQFEKIDVSQFPNWEFEKISDDVVVSFDKGNPNVKWNLYTEKRIEKLEKKFSQVIERISTIDTVACELILKK